MVRLDGLHGHLFGFLDGSVQRLSHRCHQKVAVVDGVRISSAALKIRFKASQHLVSGRFEEVFL